MVEELKIIAEIMKGVTDGAIYVAVAYVVYSFLKPVALATIFCFSLYKICRLFSPRRADEIRVLEIVDVENDKAKKS